MKSAVSRGWRNAATLVVLSERSVAARLDRCNYEVLLQTRPQGASFRNSVVFPGGVSEPLDASADWLTLLNSFGYSQADFAALHRAGSPVTPIFQDNPVLRHISLRITAIRETFEELGLLVCSREHKAERSGVFADCISDFDVKHWQNRVSKNPAELLNLCAELKCYPDIWSLHYLSNWLTPPKAKKRFDTAFFLTALKKKPELAVSNEVVKTEWSSPQEVLSRSQDLVLYPPQVYELIRLSFCNDLVELVSAAQEWSGTADVLYYHATVRAADGEIHLLPGDELYPTNIDYNTRTIINIDKTILALRESSRVAHRIEATGSTFALVFKNYKLKNIDMGDRVIPLNVTFS